MKNGKLQAETFEYFVMNVDKSSEGIVKWEVHEFDLQKINKIGARIEILICNTLKLIYDGNLKERKSPIHLYLLANSEENWKLSKIVSNI